MLRLCIVCHLYNLWCKFRVNAFAQYVHSDTSTSENISRGEIFPDNKRRCRRYLSVAHINISSERAVYLMRYVGFCTFYIGRGRARNITYFFYDFEYPRVARPGGNEGMVKFYEFESARDAITVKTLSAPTICLAIPVICKRKFELTSFICVRAFPLIREITL